MSRTVTMHGASDDLIYIDGSEFDDDEYNIVSAPRRVFAVINEEDVCAFHFLLLPGSVWTVAPSQVEEDIPLPDWGFTIEQSADCRYSAQLVFDAPEGVFFRVEGHRE